MDEDPEPLTAQERAELERLRADARDRTDRRAGRRTPLGVIAIVLGCLLAPLAVVGIWANNEVKNTDRYVENVAPLASDPTVQNAVANRVSKELTARIDVKELLDSGVQALESAGLPPRAGTALQGLEPVIAGSLDGFVREQVGRVVASDRFEQLWVNANRALHARMNRVLTGQSRAVRIDGDTLSLDLGPIVEASKRRLSDRGLTIVERVPAIDPKFAMFSSASLTKVQGAYEWLGRLAWILPIAALALIVAGVLLLRSRRKAIIGAGLGVAAGMVVLAIGLVIARSVVLGGLPKGSDPAAIAVTFDSLVRFIRIGLRALLVLAVLTALGAWFGGTGATATRVRSFAKRQIARLRFGEAGPVGAWVYRYRTPLRIGVVALAAIVLVFWSHPTGTVILSMALIVLLLLAVIELLARPPGGRMPHATA